MPRYVLLLFECCVQQSSRRSGNYGGAGRPQHAHTGELK
jgi:hypothetical protein